VNYISGNFECIERRENIMNSMTATQTQTQTQTQAKAQAKTQSVNQDWLFAEWTKVCEVTDLLPDTGVCALVHGQQVAIFFSGRLNEYFAVANFDPIGEANVLSRGMIGSIGEAIVVASPLYKQHFNLRTGQCVEKPECNIAAYQVRASDGWIEVSLS
jgi:nitrite reductase (NADH) small subunit